MTCNHPRRGFTLTELMIVIAIMAILAGLGLSAMNGATNLAREHRTGAQIAKIDQLIMERYEGFRTRAVPVKILPPNDPNRVSIYYTSQPGRDNTLLRLLALRALMRMELPDRRTDVVNFTTNPPTPEIPGYATYGSSTIDLSKFMQAAALQKSYYRTAVRAVGGIPANLTKWTVQNEGAECLYLILTTMRDGDKAALDYFDGSEIGDTDEDGMKEVLDGWGTPIEFLRWAPGYLPTSVPPVATMQNASALAAPDPFDPAKVDLRWNPTTPAIGPYALFPLIFSAGPDKKYDIVSQVTAAGVAFRYAYPPASPPALPNDPYYAPSGSLMVGTPGDIDGDGFLGFMDNITNHAIATQK